MLRQDEAFGSETISCFSFSAVQTFVFNKMQKKCSRVKCFTQELLNNFEFQIVCEKSIIVKKLKM